MAFGRPSEYTADYVQKVREYIDGCVDEYKQLVKSTGSEGGIQYENKLVVNLPSIEGCALHLNVARSTIYEWRKTYGEFSDIIDVLLQEQAKKLLNKGLSGEYNPTISKVILTKHDYIEKQALDLKTNDDEPTDAELAAIIRRSIDGSKATPVSATA
jgi:hypothetical protein